MCIYIFVIYEYTSVKIYIHIHIYVYTYIYMCAENHEGWAEDSKSLLVFDVCLFGGCSNVFFRKW